jgi:hypothetical protein
MSHRRHSLAAFFIACATLGGCATDSSAPEEPTDAHESAVEEAIELTNARLATHKSGSSNYNKKNVTTIKYSPIKVRAGIGMSSNSIGTLIDQLHAGEGLTITGVDAEGRRRRCDWTIGHVTSVKFPKLASKSAIAPVEVELEDVEIKDLELDTDPEEPDLEPEVAAWRVTSEDLDPGVAVLEVRATTFTTGDAGETWEGTLELDVEKGSDNAIEHDVHIDFLDEEGNWLSAIVLSPKDASTAKEHEGFVTITVPINDLQFPTEAAE